MRNIGTKISVYYLFYVRTFQRYQFSSNLKLHFLSTIYFRSQKSSENHNYNG